MSRSPQPSRSSTTGDDDESPRSLDPGASVTSTAVRRAPTLGSSARLALVVVLGVWTLVQARSPDRGVFLNSINLAIHETGHLVFGPFGDTMAFLGGTLFQLMVPAAFVVHFLWRGERFNATVPSWWVGQNLLGVSVYVRDARSRVLPLVGGGEHDWAYLLGQWGVLTRDQGIADAVQFSGVIVMAVTLLLAISVLSDPVGSRHAADRAHHRPDEPRMSSSVQ